MAHEQGVASLVTGIVLLLVIASLTQVVSKRLTAIPSTILLVFMGILLATFGAHVPALAPMRHFELTPELVLFVFIPTLIFESAFHLDVRQLSRNLWPILTLAVPGLILSTAIIGGIVSIGTTFPVLVALLIGAILSATDPVAVIAIFRQLGVPERLTILVEGESLFNDATSLVLAGLLTALVLAGGQGNTSVLAPVIEFLVVFVGGSLVGWGLAVLAGLLLGQVDSDAFIEITLTTILAYFSFIVAEHIFHVSGIMAVVAAGLVLGSWGKSTISPSVSEFMDEFWEYLANLANALIFLLVGLQMDLGAMWAEISLIALVCGAMLLSRAVVIFSLTPLAARLSDRVEFSYQAVMYWGGLRGAIALAIVLSLPEFAWKDTLVAIVMGAVLFTLVVQGLSIEALVRKLRLDQPDSADRLAQLEGERTARTESLKTLERLVSGGFFSERIAQSLAERCERQLASLEQEIDRLDQDIAGPARISLTGLRCLARERARALELFRRGLVNEWAFRELEHNISVQLDEVRYEGKLPGAELSMSRGQQLLALLAGALERLPGAARIAERLRTARIVRDYDVTWGRYRCAGAVLSSLPSLIAEPTDDDAIALRERYEEIQAYCRSRLEAVASTYPEFVHQMQEQLAQRLLLVAEHDAVEEAVTMGLIPGGVGNKILDDQLQRLRILKQDRPGASFAIPPEELLAKVALFKGREAAFDDISGYLRRKTIPSGSRIVRQDDAGDSLFLIARGLAHVYRDDERVATLYAGDFFGESALLHHQPRNATVIAATPCSLYELEHDALRKLMSAYPDLARDVKAIDSERTERRH